jgi:pyridoxal phosphate enzyme (YggS family)
LELGVFHARSCDPLPPPVGEGRLPAVNDSDFPTTVERIRQRIAAAAARAGRQPADVGILPITKGHPVEVLRRVAAAGFTAVGENRVREADSKQAAVGKLGLRWHMVGHLQRNKAGRAVQLFDAIESVHSVELGRRLEQVADRFGIARLSVLVQVNASGESRKSGFPLEETVDAVGELVELERVSVDGLMTMAPFTSDETVLRDTFGATREILERCRREVSAFEGRTLSMGMSNDYEIAVEEGSTEVRLGTVLLGRRPGE